MIIITVLHDRNLILKIYTSNPVGQNFNLLAIFRKKNDLPDTDNVLDSPTSFANQSSSSLLFNQSQTSSGNTGAKNDLRPMPRKKNCLFIPSPSSTDKKSYFLSIKWAKLLNGNESS